MEVRKLFIYIHTNCTRIDERVKHLIQILQRKVAKTVFCSDWYGKQCRPGTLEALNVCRILELKRDNDCNDLTSGGKSFQSFTDDGINEFANISI